MVYVLTAIVGVIWLYLLHIFRKADLRAWHFIIGALGAFALLMVLAVPYATMPMARGVAAVSGIFGSLTGWFQALFRYGIIFVQSGQESVSMLIDFECSGIIEILAFECLLAFFDVYTKMEKIIVGLFGFCVIVLLNAARIILICSLIHFFGTGIFGIAHTFIGRIFFYAFTVILYFYVFTKPQVVRMRVGNFTYGKYREDS